MVRRRTVPIILLALLSVLPTPASAHELGGSRFDAPIPLSLLFAGAAATVAFTAVLLGVLSDPDTTVEPTSGAPTGTAGPSEPTATTRTSGVTPGTEPPTASTRRRFATVPAPFARALRPLVRSVFFLLFLGAIVTGLFGTQVAAESLATTFVWPVWLKGIGLCAIAVGSPWCVLSPWRTLYVGLRRLEGGEIALLGAYPDWLGRWPALGGFLLWIGVLENLTIVSQSPRSTAVVIAGYALLMLGGAIAFGPAWLRNADALEVFYRLLGRVAPIRPRRVDDGGVRLTLRAPWDGCMHPVADLSLVAFAIAAVYTVSFDGFTSTPEFQRVLFDARDLIGIGGGVSVLLYLGGLFGFVGLFLAISWVMGAIVDAGSGWREVACGFAPTVLPIAAAYELAHNYPFVLRNLGVSLAQLASIATSTSVAPIALLDWLTVGFFWGSQVLLIVLGHVIAVVAAHRVALARTETAGQARRMHAPLVVLMVGYTVLSLWIVSRPIATG
jgi:hypothetical protein